MTGFKINHVGKILSGDYINWYVFIKPYDEESYMVFLSNYPDIFNNDKRVDHKGFDYFADNSDWVLGILEMYTEDIEWL